MDELKQTKWDIVIRPELTNFIELVRSKNIVAFSLILDGSIEAVYIFRKSCIFLKQKEEVLSCIATIRGQLLSTDEFVGGFYRALQSLLTKDDFCYLAVEDVGDNEVIVQQLIKREETIASSPTAYFFYNFAHSSINKQKCLIIN
jgi:hypothetical protein